MSYQQGVFRKMLGLGRQVPEQVLFISIHPLEDVRWLNILFRFPFFEVDLISIHVTIDHL